MTMRRDGRIGRRVGITRGTYKGYSGLIKEVTGANARVELYTVSKTITINVDYLKEQK
jgi:transcription elongation factor SPT5